MTSQPLVNNKTRHFCQNCRTEIPRDERFLVRLVEISGYQTSNTKTVQIGKCCVAKAVRFIDSLTKQKERFTSRKYL